MSDVKHTEERTETHSCVSERTETHGDLISRKAAIDSIGKCTDIYVNNLPTMIDKAEAYKALNELPSAEQGQHGRWEFIGDQMFRCPECGQTFSKMLLEGWGTYLDRLYLPPCPICGADMRGEQDESN